MQETGFHTSIVPLLLEDSVQLFLLSLALNILDVILWRFYNYEWTLSGVLMPLTSILIARCLLHLKEADPALTWSTPGDQQSLEFAPGDHTGKRA